MVTTEQFVDDYQWIEDARHFLPRHASRKWQERSLDRLDGLVWHQTLGGTDPEATARYHVGPNHISSEGLPSISYTFFIKSDGAVWLCNDLEAVTYSQGDRTKPGDENVAYLAACFGGNFSGPGYRGSAVPTVDQLFGGLRLWKSVKQFFGFENYQLFGHYHFGKPACPGTSLQSLIEMVRADCIDLDFGSMATRQTALKRLGYYRGAIDGVWGPVSRDALLGFQKSNGLSADGVWGRQTERAIHHAIDRSG